MLFSKDRAMPNGWISIGMDGKRCDHTKARGRISGSYKHCSIQRWPMLDHDSALGCGDRLSGNERYVREHPEWPSKCSK